MTSLSLQKLLAASSSPLGPSLPTLDADLRVQAGSLAAELEQVLTTRNGFYAFESALHMFAIAAPNPCHDLRAWNADDFWISAYEGLADGMLFFAEDIFGVQFAIRDSQIWTFNPETGEIEFLVSSFAEWGDRLADDYEMLTGYPFAQSWQREHGPLAQGQRLLPKTPFVLGGEYDVSNLYALDAAKGMQFRASIAVQLRDLPDGAQVDLRVLKPAQS